MPTYLHPGVYVEEIAGGSRPIEAVGTSTAAFVGIAEKGPLDEARFITNFTEFTQIYGGYESDKDIGKSYLAYSVYQFFQNGGTACYVVRVEAEAETAQVGLYTADNALTITIEAISPGAWGNGLKIAIGDATTSKTGFNMYVFMGDELVETYEDLSLVDSNPFFVDAMTKRSLFIKTTATSLPDNPTLTGRQDLSTGANLQAVKKIRLQIDTFGPYTIDCSEKAGDTSAVTADEIAANINKAFEEDIDTPVASVSNDRIVITSPSVDENAKIVLTPPGNEDATFDILGLQESSWRVRGRKETIAQALGVDKPHLTAERTLTIALGNGSAIDIPKIPASTPQYDIVSMINGVVADVAYTDGVHVVLSTDQDITIKRSDPDKITVVKEIFGDEFYSYVHRGSGNNTASIVGNADITAPFTGQLRLKVDNFPSFIVDFNTDNTATPALVADTINNAYQKVSKNKKKIAQASGARITLNSFATGANGRIIVSSIPGSDVAATVLGTAHESDDDFIFPAEELSVARLDGIVDFSTAGIGEDLAGVTLRMSADGPPTRLENNLANSADISELFTIFGAQTDLNHKLLLRVADTQTVHMIAPRFSGVPELRFSIPLTAEEASAHVAAAAAEAVQPALRRLFGDIDPFRGNPDVLSPRYNYTFGSPNNNPRKTVLGSGEEPDFSRSLSLSGGDQDRTNEMSLRDLTTGAANPSVPTGLRLLDKLTDISILVIPGWSNMSDAVARTFIASGTDYCDKVRPAQARPLRDLFFVTNPPASVNTPVMAKDFAMNQISKSAGGYAALYYPWLEVNDPIGTSSPTLPIPPAGPIAGLYASIDGRRGVWKAPAGTEAGLANVVKLTDKVSDVKQDLLNPHGVNAIRRMPGAGIVSWGARTLHTNPEWKYVPVRRMAIMIEVSIYEGIQWAVFEPNDAPLWSMLRLNINAFMTNLFRSGAFQGSTPSAAFFVKCDNETTTQVDIDLGKVNVLVGFAPLKPAEFVIVKISQKAGQSE